MHYRHAFHAGNFADVWKHCILHAVLQAMNRKPAPWSYLESHAGAGRYRLPDDGARTPAEWRDGIARVQDGGPPDSLAEWLALVRDAGAGCYPGSPAIALAMARADDQLLLFEAQPEVAAALQQTCGQRARVQQRDGYALDAALPPRHRRVVLLLDPPFNRADEYSALGDLVEACLRRCAHAVTLVWYPRKQRHEADRLVRRLARVAGKPVWHAMLDVGSRQDGRMHACGMVVINPPYGVDDALAAPLAWLAAAMARGSQASHRLEWIDP